MFVTCEDAVNSILLQEMMDRSGSSCDVAKPQNMDLAEIIEHGASLVCLSLCLDSHVLWSLVKQAEGTNNLPGQSGPAADHIASVQLQSQSRSTEHRAPCDARDMIIGRANSGKYCSSIRVRILNPL